MSDKLRHAVATILGVALLSTSSLAGAQTAKEQELEKRVAELEKMVQQLVAEKQAAPAAPAAAPAVAAAPPKPDPKAIQPGTILPSAAPGTSLVFSGFAKVDGMWTDTPDGEMADGASGRDYYVPGQIPVAGLDEGTDFNAHAKQSRLNIGTDTVLASGDKVSTRFEFDFYGAGSGSQNVSNAYQPMVRHAYIQWREWLVGQTWTNFMDASLLPETTDYIGPTDGTIFVRQSQVRWTKGGLSLSVENPQTTFTKLDGSSASSDDNAIPDLTARYTWKGNWGMFAVAGLARELKYETTGAGAIDASTWTAAGSAFGKFMIGKDDLRFAVSAGNLGRYAVLNFTNDAVLAADGDFETIDGVMGWIGYRHLWTDKWRSNIFFAMGDFDNPSAYTGDKSKISKSSSSWTLNLFYSPLPKLDIGAEWRSAQRELENGKDGDLNRLQFTTKYSF
ncbi:MAG TPA: DcaP family trimeric outer membrane transporter [Steroidobacteraceae bacterium]